MAIPATPRRTISTRCSTEFLSVAKLKTKRRPRAGVFLFPGKPGRSRPRRAADIDHVAVTGAGILLDEAGDQHASVERDNLAVLLAGGGGRRGPRIFCPLC